MRGAVRNKKRWKGRLAPTQDPSTNHLPSRTGMKAADLKALLAEHGFDNDDDDEARPAQSPTRFWE